MECVQTRRDPGSGVRTRPKVETFMTADVRENTDTQIGGNLQSKGQIFTQLTALTSEAALRRAWQVRWGVGQQGIQVLAALGDTFGVPVSGAKHLHRLPH